MLNECIGKLLATSCPHIIWIKYILLYTGKALGASVDAHFELLEPQQCT